MKKFGVIPVLIASLLATQALAGTLTVSGSLTVTTNLTAQSITLGGVTETNWTGVGSLPLQGYKYVIVAEGTNDVQRGNNLQTAYATATTLGPAAAHRVVVLVQPGSYNLGTTGLTMNTSYVDLIGLVPAQMTTKQIFTNSAGGLSIETAANVQCPVCIYATISGTSGIIKQTADYVRIESVVLTNTTPGACYYPTVSGTNTVLRHVSMMGPMPLAGEFAGLYVDCIGGHNSFGATASGTFIDCLGGSESFGGGGTASGSFINCTGGGSSFGGSGGGTASGSFINCTDGDNSFGAGGTANGTFINCTSGANGFGGNGGNLDTSAKLQHCIGGSGSFGSLNIASGDFNYNVGGTNTFLMLPQLPTSSSTNGLPSGTVYNSSGTLKIMP